MLKFFMKHKGSVSIMMAIILLPTMALSALLVDLANRNMSKAMVESAGDLAASSALANYDSVLADVYGLFAISQTEKDLKENLTQYFTDTLDAAGLLSAEVENQLIPGLVDAIDLAALNDPLIDVDVEVTEAAGVPNTALSDPHILQGQIIEFMKYRGPVEVGLDLLDMVNALKGMNDKSKVTNQQMKVDEELSDLASAEKLFYRAIKNCDAVVKDVQTELTSLNQKVPNWGDGTHWELAQFYLEQANKTLVQKVAFMPDLEQWPLLCVENVVGSYVGGEMGEGLFANSHFMIEEYKYDVALGEKPSADYANSWTIQEMVYNTSKDYTEYDFDRDIVPLLTGDTPTITDNFLDSVMAPTVEADGLSGAERQALLEDSYKQYSERMQKLILLSEYSDALSRAYREVKEQIEEASEYDEALENERQLIYDRYQRVYDFLEETKRKTDFYFQQAKQIIFECRESYSRLGTELGSSMKEIHPLYKALRTADDPTINFTAVGLKPCENVFELAIELGETVIQHLGEVKAANDDYHTSAEAYKETVGEDGFYSQAAKEADNNDTAHSAEAVQKVIDQLKAVEYYLVGTYSPDGYARIPSLKGMLEGTFYNQKPITDDELLMNGREVERGVFYGQSGKLLLEGLSDFDPGKAEEYMGDYVFLEIAPKENTPEVYLKQIGALLKDGDLTVPIPEYYVYLMSTYEYKNEPQQKDEDDDSEDAGDKVTGSASKMGDQAKGSTTADSLDYSGQTDLFDGLLREESGGGTSTGSTSLSVENSKTGIMKTLEKVIETTSSMLDVLNDPVALLEGLRDNLLTTEYIYENFSNYITSVDAAEPGAKIPQTMTNVPITGDNNVFYGCEVEYALYGARSKGDKGPEANVDTALNRIFLIRMLCNSIFALTDQSIQGVTIGPALAIQAATFGVFPYKLAQVVLDLCLALAESIWDVSEIKASEDVVLFKTFKTFVMGGAGALTAIANKAVDNVMDKASEEVCSAIEDLSNAMQTYVDQGVDFTVDKVEDVSGELAENAAAALTEAVNDALEGMMTALTGEVESIYVGFFTATSEAEAVLSPEAIRSRLTETVNSFIQTQEDAGKISDKVGSFLQKYSGTAVSYVMDYKVKLSSGSEGKSVTDILSEVNTTLNTVNTMASGNGETITLGTSSINQLKQALGEIPAKFIDEKVQDLEETVNGWVEGLGGQVKETINGGITELENEAKEEVVKLTADAAEEIKGEISDAIGEYFPAEAENLFGDAAESSGGFASTLKFGYEDYLRLFLFLSLLSEENRSSVLTRTGELVTLNLKNGLKGYYKQADLPNGHPAGENFYLNDAYTYVSISANVTIDPLLIDQSFIQQGAERVDETTGAVINPMEGRESIWKYSFTCLAGY